MFERSYIYLHTQQKHLSSHTKIDCTGVWGEGNNSIDMILFYDFHQSTLGNNMELQYEQK